MTDPKFVEMDPHVGMRDQLADEGGHMILINHFTVNPSEAEAFVESWTRDANFFKSQPGYISTQLHRGIAGSGSFLNYAVWESVTQYRAAFEQLQARTGDLSYPEGMTVSPHLFRKIAVPSLCVA